MLTRSFISAVSDEFASERSEILANFHDRDWELRVQENFFAPGKPILCEISDYIQAADGVIQLIGSQAGNAVVPADIDAVLAKHPDLLTKLAVDRPYLERLSYTQFEAYLAIFHDRSLWLAPHSPQHPTRVESTSDTMRGIGQVLSQAEHIELLRIRGHFPASQLQFDSAQGLELAIRRWIPTEVAKKRCTFSARKTVDSFHRAVGADLIGDHLIDRPETATIASNLQSGNSVLLAAQAGSGKSCVLASTSKTLRDNSIPHLIVRLDDHPSCQSLNSLSGDFDFGESLDAAMIRLANDHPDTGAVLIVDQLDAISTVSGRNIAGWTMFEQLWNGVKDCPGVRLVVACRDFDLQHDHRLRILTHEDAGFARVLLGKLDDDLILEHVKPVAPNLNLNRRQLDILSTPLHLHLYLQGDPSRPFTRVGELLDRYWDRKRRDYQLLCPNDFADPIGRLTDLMNAEQSTSLSLARVNSIERQVDRLESLGVVHRDERSVRFFHESFFDYAFARRFAENGVSIVDFLLDEYPDQPLFCRSMVRQILGYRRDADEEAYRQDLAQLLSDHRVRENLRRMVARELARIDSPTDDEWDIVEPFFESGELSGTIRQSIRGNVGWFDRIDGRGLWGKWLASGDQARADLCIWFLEESDLNRARSTRIAELIRPYLKANAEQWRKRLAYFFHWDIAHLSDEMSSLYFDFVRTGVYASEEFARDDRGMFDSHYKAVEESPEFWIELVKVWFELAVRRYDDGKTHSLLSDTVNARSDSAVDAVAKLAITRPRLVLQTWLPMVIDAIRQTSFLSSDRSLNRVWPLLSNSMGAYRVDDAVLAAVRDSLAWLALNDIDEFREQVESLKEDEHETIWYLLLWAFAANPEELATECVDYLLADRRRLFLGYGSWSGEGNGESAVSRRTLSKISSQCSDEELSRLEDAIIGYADALERATPDRRGYGEFLVLQSIDESSQSHRVKTRISELRCKFPEIRSDLPSESDDLLVSAVGSPISHDNARKMTDEQWIFAMQKYDGTTDRMRGGPVELSRELAIIAHDDRPRFARLLDLIPDDVHPCYPGAILESLAGRNLNLSAEEKKEDQAARDALPMELFAKAITRCHALPNRPCGKGIADLLDSLAHRELPTDLIEILKWHATESPDPKEDIWKDAAKNYYGGKPFDHGINTVRGRSALAVGRLIAKDANRLTLLSDTVRRMSRDPVTSVRCCVVEALRCYPAERSDEAVEVFAQCVQERDDVALGSTFSDFFHRFFVVAQDDLLPILKKLIESDNEKIRVVAAKLIAMADLGGFDTNGLADLVVGGDVPLRRKATEVAVRHIARDASEEVLSRAFDRLVAFFEDDDDEVRSTSARCFLGMSGEKLQASEAMIRRFINSEAFISNPSDLLRALERSSVKMPEVIHLAVERLLETIGNKAADFQHRVAIAGMSAATLVVRQYVQSKDPTVRTRCMDLIDQMDALGYSGLGDELEKLDR